MTLTTFEAFMIVCVVALGTMITRFLPFMLLKGKRADNPYITYLGQVLPYAAIGLLVVYCLRNINFQSHINFLPEVIAVGFVAILHYWKENTLLSIGLGTLAYMLLVQVVFV
jgi:branched-subunit amino acid transport protein AzlD